MILPLCNSLCRAWTLVLVAILSALFQSMECLPSNRKSGPKLADAETIVRVEKFGAWKGFALYLLDQHGFEPLQGPEQAIVDPTQNSRSSTSCSGRIPSRNTLIQILRWRSHVGGRRRF